MDFGDVKGWCLRCAAFTGAILLLPAFEIARREGAVTFDLGTIKWESVSAVFTGIGTLVALYFSWMARDSERKRQLRKERDDRVRAVRLEIMIFNELSILFSMTLSRFNDTHPEKLGERTTPIWVVHKYYAACGLPMTEKMLGEISILPLVVSGPLLDVLVRIHSIKADSPPTDAQFALWTEELFRKSMAIVRKDSAFMLLQIVRTMQAIKSTTNHPPGIGEIPTTPEDALAYFRED